MQVAGFQLQQPLSSSEHHYAFTAKDESGKLHRIYGVRYPGSGSDDLFLWSRTRMRRALLVSHPCVASGRTLIDQADHFQVAICMDQLVEINQLQHSQLKLDWIAKLADLLAGLASAHRVGAAHECLAPGRVYQSEPASINTSSCGNYQIDLLEWLIGASSDARNGSEVVLRLNDAERLAKDVTAAGALLDWLALHIEMAPDIKVQIRHISHLCCGDDWTTLPTITEIAELVRSLTEASSLETGEIERTQVSDQALSSPPRAARTHEETLASEVVEQYAAPNKRNEVPATVGRFAIQKRLGEGGMGAVYLAIDPTNGEQVAIKVISQKLSRNDRVARRFAKEARMLSTVRHPAIACLVEFNGERDPMYLAMELVSGGSLSEFLKGRKPLPEKLALALIADAARGLSAAHYGGMVHRDIKPANLLLTDRGRRSLERHVVDDSETGPLLKLADFGLAKHHDSEESIALTQTGMILGTPIYMSPEQCRAEKVDPATDVYALGVTLFQCLTGRPPFEGESTVAVIRHHCETPVPNMRTLNSSVSDSVQRIVEKCLNKNPLMRQRDAGELLVDLERAINGEPSSMLVHPTSINRQVPGVLDFRFEWNLLSSPASIWPYVSNTDRVNHAIGLPAVKYRTFVDPKLGVRRMAMVKTMGMTLEWEEHPYEWVEGRRLSVLRQFPSGPFHWFINVVELHQVPGGGTRVTQQLSMLPRNLIGNLFGKYSIGRNSGRNFGRIYKRIDDYIVSQSSSRHVDNPFGKSRTLSAFQSRMLANRIDRAKIDGGTVEPTIFDTLAQYIEHASDLDVARIRPIAFAERFGLKSSDVVHACLLLAREGVLVLLWDILCPTCRIPSDVQETMKNLLDHAHCEACNADFEIDFSKSVELVFRVHPEIRHAETRTYCIGGPAFSSHVVVQTRLAAQERLAIELELSDGQYRLRGPQLPYVVDLRVSPLGRTSRIELDLGRPISRSDVPVLRSGSQVILLKNTTTDELQIRLERMASRSDAFTAADASRLPAFRQWFPGEVLSPGQMVSLTTATLMACQISSAHAILEQLGDSAGCAKLLEQLQWVARHIAQCQGCVTKTMPDTVYAVFPSVLAAMEAAEQIITSVEQASNPIMAHRISLTHGPTIVATINDRLDYFGRISQQLNELLPCASPSQVCLSSSCLNEPGTLASLSLKWQLDTRDEFHLAQPRDANEERRIDNRIS